MSTNETNEDKSAKDRSIDPEVDDELSSLLDSALNDFNIKPTNTDPKSASATTSVTTCDDLINNKKIIPELSAPDVGSDPFDDKLNEDLAKFDEMFSPLINSDPELKEHWSRLTKSCAEAATASNEDEFQHSLQETLKTISDKAQAVVGEENNLSEEELARIWSNLGIGADDEENGSNNFANLMPLMTNMMQNLLSKELLYPALNELAEKYPTFLNENKDKLSAEELKRYTKQMELMKEVCEEFDSESTEDSEAVKKERFQRILTVMQAMQSCGSPPSDLIGDLPDFGAGLPPDLNIGNIPGLNADQNAGQCCIM